ncbi:hypothetical protein B1J92_B04301g [Nakaseomyces glabratus]|nr:hypothetical protein B1J91_B04301g [Nakaseomyces glabratus]OXB50537.1 hypothetical protein B1J92_B04301g [Nakaseomyces glabratus]
MVFSLDEELLKPVDGAVPRTIITSEGSGFMPLERNDAQAYEQGHLSVGAAPIPRTKARTNSNSQPLLRGRRRRSSVLDKFSVYEPEFIRRVSLGGAGSFPQETQFLDGSYKECAVFDEEDEDGIDGGAIIGGDVRTGISREISDFKPIRVLGQGAYGKVILVKDKQTSKLYAMKQLKKAEILIAPTDANTESMDKLAELDKPVDSEDEKLSKRIERTFAERTILSQLEHPNIVKLFYSFHDTSKLYLLLQYIPGGELFFHLKEHGTLEEDTVAFYAAEISCALKFLHSKGVVYRDLKPENCLLNQNGHLVLTDFGLSKSSASNASQEDLGAGNEGEDVNELHSIIGTPEYCAPEILLGQPYTANCDWYSLGCLLYDMLTGKPPYTGANHKVIANKIKNDKQGPKIPYYLSDGMKDVLGALLKSDPKKRWDVDKYWSEPKKDNSQKKGQKKKKSKERTSPFQSHFVFRKVDWKGLSSGELQNTTFGPIVPVITDWELAENFDSEFTSMSYEEDDFLHPLHNKSPDAFKGFSFKASGSYLEKYF